MLGGRGSCVGGGGLLGGNDSVSQQQLERRWSMKVRGFSFHLTNKVFVAPCRDGGALLAAL